MSKIINFILSIGLIGSQVYLFSSGLPQPAHVALVLGILLYVLLNGLRIKLDELGKTLIFILWLLFVYVAAINLIWAILLGDLSFIKSIIYWLFACLIFGGFYVLLTAHLGLDNWLRIAIPIGVGALLVIWMFGLGRYDYYPRYNGLFNDPNQMAYWLICVYAIYFYISSAYKDKYILLGLSLSCLFAILLTQSRSGFVGGVLILVATAMQLTGISSISKIINWRMMLFVAFMIVSTFSVYLFWGDTDVVKAAIERSMSTDLGEQADIRGYNRIVNYPEYLLFGAGQGLDLRFGSYYEIHSTWAGILFYYGIFGSALFIYLLSKIYIRLELPQKITFLAVCGYAFSTYGARTPVFWIFLASAASVALKSNIEIKAKLVNKWTSNINKCSAAAYTQNR